MLSAALFAGAAGWAGCTTVDDSLGSNLVPDTQQMRAGYATFPLKKEPNPKKYVETRLFQSDSIRTSNISYGYIGSQLNDTLGLRSAGFLTQYLYYVGVDADRFGERPIFDSAQLLLTVTDYARDTLTPQLYGIYEITDNAYLTERKDSTFYLDFDPDPYVSKTPLFTFEFPDGKKTGPATTSVTLDLAEGGREFIDRLMLQSGKYAGNYSIYTTLDSLAQWVDEFKGLYIRPLADQTAKSKGGMYALDLSGSGLAVYGRTRLKEDPSLIKDTLSLLYIFKDTELSSTHGNVSVNVFKRNYEGSKIDPAQVREPAPGTPDNRKTDSRMIVEGMGGVVTEITFTKEFFNELESKIEEANREGYEFSTLAFSQARMLVYFGDSDYEWDAIDPAAPGRLIFDMDAAPERIGLYTNYKTLTAIPDYNYYYEKNYDTSLAYGGYINRSRGCYTFDITGYIQTLWNSYAAERDAARSEEREIDLTKIENRTIYAAPEAYSYYTPAYTVLQGMTTLPDDPAGNNAPIRFELTYNLIKK